MKLGTIAKLLADTPTLNAILDLDDIITYIDLVQLLKSDLSLWIGCHQTEPPERLPLAVHDFLKLCIGLLDDEVAKLTWTTLGPVAWEYGYNEGLQNANRASIKYMRLFLEHGLCRGISKSKISEEVDVRKGRAN